MRAVWKARHDKHYNELSYHQLAEKYAPLEGISTRHLRRKLAQVESTPPAELRSNGHNLLTYTQELALVGLILARSEDSINLSRKDVIDLVAQVFLSEEKAKNWTGAC